MLFLLAVLFAIPTFGGSMLAYLAWIFYKVHRTKCRELNLSKVERAILLVAKEHNGSLMGASVDDMGLGYVLGELYGNSIYPTEVRDNSDISHYEFEIAIGSMTYDVHLSRAPDNNEIVLFRVRRAERWLDEVFRFLVDEAGCSDRLLSKYYLNDRSELIAGAAHLPEYSPVETIYAPESLGKLVNLEVLGFINRNLGSLPKSIGKLTKLRELKLGGNSLKELPVELCELSNLKILTFWMNDLEDLPAEIGNLRNLEGLDLSSNNLSRLPDSIVNLKNLKRLYMTGNEKLTLSTSQKAWLIDLLKNGTSVSVDKFRKDQIIVEYSELATLNRDWFIPEV